MKEPRIANNFLSYLYLTLCLTALALTAATDANLKEPKVRLSHPFESAAQDSANHPNEAIPRHARTTRPPT